MSLRIEDIEVAGYERVARAEDPRTGLRAFIAVHDTTLGPGAGGIRMWPWASEQEGLTDVLRLAQGMTYKSAVARNGLGGGKSLILADSRRDKTPDLFEAMGRFVDAFEGTYYAAEDVGTTTSDLEHVASETRFVTGLPRARGGSGDPSIMTALGTFLGIKACLGVALGSEDPAGRRIVIQGTGSVGARLARHLVGAGAALALSDIHADRVQDLAEELGAAILEPSAVYDEPCDVLSPCALGAVLNDRTVPRLRCKVVAGAANNQLQAERHGQALADRGILYAPDFVINAGGIINVGVEFLDGGYDEDEARRRVEQVYGSLRTVLETATSQGISTSDAALMLANDQLAAGRAAS